MCVMAGCDFLPNLPGLGIKKANALVRKHRDFVKVWVAAMAAKHVGSCHGMVAKHVGCP